MRKISLNVHLRLLALGRRGQSDDPEHARAHPFGDGLDRAALACPVSPLEQDADFRPGALDPFLELDELDVKTGELVFIGLPLELFGSGGRLVLFSRHLDASLAGCCRFTRGMKYRQGEWFD